MTMASADAGLNFSVNRVTAMVRRSTLEDVFLALTGRTLVD